MVLVLTLHRSPRVVIVEINPLQRVMGTSANTGGTSKLAFAVIALCRLHNGLLALWLRNRTVIGIADRGHRNIVVRTGIRTGRTANAGQIVNNDAAGL